MRRSRNWNLFSRTVRMNGEVGMWVWVGSVVAVVVIVLVVVDIA